MRITPLLTVFLASCVATEQVNTPASTSSSGAVLLVVDVKTSTTPSIVHAFGSLDSVELPLTLRNGAKVDAYLLPYACDLPSLGWLPGKVELSSDPETGWALPAPTEILFGGFDGVEAREWIELPEPPAALLSIRVSPSAASPCSSFERHEFQIDGFAVAGLSLAVALDDERALLSPKPSGGPSVEFFEVTRMGASSVLEANASTPNNAAFRFNDGTLLLVGVDGETAIGTISAGFTRIASRASGGRERAWLDGSKEDGPIEVFAVTDKLGFGRFDGTVWHQLRPPIADESIFFGGVIRLGEMDALAFGPDPSGILHWRADEIAVESYANIRASDPITLFMVPDLGPILASANGQIFRRTDTWSPYGPTTEKKRRPISSAINFKGSLIMADRGSGVGLVRQFFPQDSFCPEIEITPTPIKILAPLPNGFVAVSDINNGASVVLMLESKAGSSCLSRSIHDFEPRRNE